MRVAILSCVYPPYGGGIGKVAYHAARLLASEHEVTVFTPHYRTSSSFMKAPGVTVESLRPWGSFGNAAFVPQLLWRLRKFDVVHLHYPFFGAHELLPFLPKRVRLVVTYLMVPQAPGFKGWLFRLGLRLSERRLIRRAKVLLTPTQDYLATVVLPRLGHESRWHVLPLGVEESYRPGEPSRALEHSLGIPEHMPVVLFVGSLDAAHAFKGVSVLLTALAHLKHRTWRLLVVGRGNARPTYEAQAQQLGLQRQVRFVGYVAEAELPDYYRLASVFVLPSTSGAETFGLVILQAMACGIPVVASRLPGVRAVVRERRTGLLVPPGDATALAAALDHLLGAPAEARAMGTSGALVVEHEYRWGAIGQQLRNLYRHAL